MGRHFLESIYNLMAKYVRFELILVVQRFLLNYVNTVKSFRL